MGRSSIWVLIFCRHSPVTTRIKILLVGNPELNLYYATVTGWGGRSNILIIPNPTMQIEMPGTSATSKNTNVCHFRKSTHFHRMPGFANQHHLKKYGGLKRYTSGSTNIAGWKIDLSLMEINHEQWSMVGGSSQLVSG